MPATNLRGLKGPRGLKGLLALMGSKGFLRDPLGRGLRSIMRLIRVDGLSRSRDLRVLKDFGDL